MDAKERRGRLLEKLRTAEQPLTGTWLAKELGVSRQVIVTDFAILRAAGNVIYATPQGYLLPLVESSKSIKATLACKHSQDELEEELSIIVDNGGKVLDVIVDHSLYGELKANLMLGSRREIGEFLHKLKDGKAEQLASITGGVHLHTIEIPNEEVLTKIKEELKSKGILMLS
ncbi:transcription repressor NadR [Pelosinus baikalensis]|uniref:Transcription repressor NadR n=1 Tax=Pelosinus baikalensis TaxID=2892015 RepID=A0ABS8HV80_9FIRM|nr:transcription repressor NadR [Pelosinus baikalensis]MCC5466945.1 transcription repressor NadR [Pelosinus baikalensis]